MATTESDQFDDWVQVAEVGQLWQGELIVGRLRAGGIAAQIVDQTFHQEPVPSVRSLAVVRVLVPADQQDDAKRVLAEDAEGTTPPAAADEEKPE